jgi:hypothetical protein
MKAVKCVLAVLLGVVMGLLPSCSSKKKAGSQPVTPGEKKQTGAADREEEKRPPDKEEDLPVRRPILE